MRGTATPWARSSSASQMAASGFPVGRPTRRTTSGPARKIAFMLARISSGCGSAQCFAASAATQVASATDPTGWAMNGAVLDTDTRVQPSSRVELVLDPLCQQRNRCLSSNELAVGRCLAWCSAVDDTNTDLGDKCPL